MSCPSSCILRCSIKVKECKTPKPSPSFPNLSCPCLLTQQASSLHLLSSLLAIHSTPEMLSSLNSHDEEDDPDHLPHHHHHQHHHHHHHHPNPPPGFITQPGHIRELLITSADLISRGNLAAARHAVSLLSASASPCGDAIDRVAHVFARALSLRVSRHALVVAAAAPAPAPPPPPDTDALGSAYLLLNQVTPFIRFCHLTANQAILEAVDRRRSVHILDFDTAHGVQWPPLLQAIAERWADPASRPSIRITGTGPDLDTLRRTGERLKSFAQTLGLRFQFFPLLLPSTGIMSSSSSSAAATASATDSSSFFNLSAFQLHPGETLAVNCVLFLHKLLRDDSGDDSRELRPFLRALRAMKPAVVTVAEREASHNSPIFLHRFTEALDHYAAMFESLEATLPASSQERLTVEQVWFGREVADVVAGEGEERRERHERFERWERAMWGAGFSNLPLSPFALSQAKLLLRIHYPLEGYHLQMVKDSLFLGWRGRPLFSVSSWKP